MKNIFLLFIIFILVGCTTTEYISHDYTPQDDVYLNVETYTNPTLIPYTNLYIDIYPFNWYWGSYYYYPTYFYSWYYYPSYWSPYWYEWGNFNYSHGSYYYGHRKGQYTDIPSPNPNNEIKRPISRISDQKPISNLQKPKYIKPYTLAKPQTKYEYKSPSSKSMQSNIQPKSYYYPQQKVTPPKQSITTPSKSYYYPQQKTQTIQKTMPQQKISQPTKNSYNHK